MNAPQAFVVALTEPEWRVIEEGLKRRPWYQADPIMQKIGEQIRAQLPGVAPAPALPEDEEARRAD